MAAGVIAVTALVVGAILLGGEPRVERIAHDASAATALVTAYERSRTATYAIESVFRRRLRNGREITLTTTLAQRDGARLSISDTSIDGVLDGYAVGCTRAAAEHEWECRRGLAQDLEGAAEAETDTLRSLVTGGRDLRVYSVTRQGDRCFALRLTRIVLAPPYGRDAVLCFDPQSGALSRSDIRRAEGRDVTRATRIVLDPDAHLFALPAPLSP